jgi:hypothetical protein
LPITDIKEKITEKLIVDFKHKEKFKAVAAGTVSSAVTNIMPALFFSPIAVISLGDSG